MRRKDKKITTPEEIKEILKNNDICRIASSKNNIPYITVMNYGYAANSLYFHCASEGKKLDFIDSNNHVCFEITDSIEIISGEMACDYGTKYRSIIGEGKILRLTDIKEKAFGLQVIMHQITGKSKWKYRKSIVEKVTVLKLEIESLSGKKSGV